MSARRPDAGRLLRGAILLAFAALIAKLFAAGQMGRYMAPALDPLTALAGIALAVMGAVEVAAARTPAPSHGHDHGADPLEQALTVALVLLPLAIGFAVAPRALGAGALGGESVARLLLAYAPGPAPAAGAAPAASARPIDDTADLIAYLERAGRAGAGQRVRAAGIAMRPEGVGPGEFVLLRYAIAHCVADARPLALLVTGPPPPEDRWVSVEGALASTERDGTQLVTIAADRVTPIPEPANPYLTSF